MKKHARLKIFSFAFACTLVCAGGAIAISSRAEAALDDSSSGIPPASHVECILNAGLVLRANVDALRIDYYNEMLAASENRDAEIVSANAIENYEEKRDARVALRQEFETARDNATSKLQDSVSSAQDEYNAQVLLCSSGISRGGVGR